MHADVILISAQRHVMSRIATKLYLLDLQPGIPMVKQKKGLRMCYVIYRLLQCVKHKQSIQVLTLGSAVNAFAL